MYDVALECLKRVGFYWTKKYLNGDFFHSLQISKFFVAFNFIASYKSQKKLLGELGSNFKDLFYLLSTPYNYLPPPTPPRYLGPKVVTLPLCFASLTSLDILGQNMMVLFEVALKWFKNIFF